MPQASATAAAPATSPLRVAVAGSVALGVAIGIGRFIYTPILPPMMAALGLSKLAAGLIASANFAGYLEGALLATGPRLTTRRWILGALIVSALTTGAMGVARSLPLFLILRVTGGIASAVILVLTCAAVLESLAESDRAELGTVMFAGVGAGIALSAAMVAALRAMGLGWPALWAASGALSMLGAPVCWQLLPVGKPHSPAMRASAARLDRRFTRLTIAYGLFGFGYIITATFLVAIVRTNADAHSIDQLVWVIFGLSAVPSVGLWYAIGQRLSTANAFALAALIEALGVVGTVIWHGVAGVLLATLLIGGTFMGLTALGLTRGRELAARNPQRGLALMTSAFGLGQIVGPSFAGALSDRLGSFTLASMIAAAALAVAAGLIAI